MPRRDFVSEDEVDVPTDHQPGSINAKLETATAASHDFAATEQVPEPEIARLSRQLDRLNNHFRFLTTELEQLTNRRNGVAEEINQTQIKLDEAFAAIRREATLGPWAEGIDGRKYTTEETFK